MSLKIVYKLVRFNKGKYWPLFIDKKHEYKLNEWHIAHENPTKGFALRKGFHCCTEPNAPHLKEKLANGEKRVWLKCRVEDWKYFERPESQGGQWVLAQQLWPIEEFIVTYDKNEQVIYN